MASVHVGGVGAGHYLRKLYGRQPPRRPAFDAGPSVVRFPYLPEFNDTRFRVEARNDD